MVLARHGAKEKGVTCTGFWGLGFWDLSGERGKVLHVTVSGVWWGGGKRCHM